MKRKHTKETSTSAVPAKSSVRTGLLIEIFAVLILAGIPFALGKYFEFNQTDPFDGGAYVYSAWHVYQGAKAGSEEIVSAQPATFLMNYLGVAISGYSELGPETIQMLLQLAGLGLMYYTLRKCFGKTAAVISAATASIYLSAPMIAKFGNVKEQFMIPFMIMTVCTLMLTIKTKKEWLWAVVGALSIWPYFFKPTGLSILATTGLCALLIPLPKWQWTTFLNRLLFLAGGALAGVVPMFLFFYYINGSVLFLKTFPVLLSKAIILLVIIGYIVIALIQIHRKYPLLSRIKTVRPVFWLAGAAAILVMHIIGIIVVRCQPDSIGADMSNYIYATPIAATAVNVLYRVDSFIVILWKSLGTNDNYLTGSRTLMGLSQQAPIVLRYYAVLKLPVLMGFLSLGALLVRIAGQFLKKISNLEPQDWMGISLALWWIFDMAMIWVSPRSYEQYYLPMCAPASMLGGYLVWLFMKYFNPATHLAGRFLAPIALLVMTAMVWPIFAGIKYSPFSGQKYDQRTRGYVQSWKSIRAKIHNEEIGPWEQLADYIRIHSNPQDLMYVWGWYPGIYVRAQRLSSSPQATEGNMHILPPFKLTSEILLIVKSFTQHPPKFIVDSRKREFPWNVPPLELWPQVPKELQGDQKGFLSTNPIQVKRFEMSYSAFLAQKVSPEEAGRFDAMKPLRDYVMQNYKVAGVYGPHVLFVRTTPAGTP